MFHLCSINHSALGGIGNKPMSLSAPEAQRKGMAVFEARTQRKLNDRRAELTAISRSQAMIAFTMDSTIIRANEHLLATGHDLHRIVGRHHRMVADPDDQNRPDYCAVWQSRAAGDVRSAAFKRRRTDGSRLRLNATDESHRQISDIRLASRNVVDALSAIRHAIDAVDQFVTSSASAVEPQNSVTRMISRNMQAAASQATELWAA